MGSLSGIFDPSQLTVFGDNRVSPVRQETPQQQFRMPEIPKIRTLTGPKIVSRPAPAAPADIRQDIDQGFLPVQELVREEPVRAVPVSAPQKPVQQVQPFTHFQQQPAQPRPIPFQTQPQPAVPQQLNRQPQPAVPQQLNRQLQPAVPQQLNRQPQPSVPQQQPQPSFAPQQLSQLLHQLLSSKRQVTFSKTLSSRSLLRSPPTLMEPLSHMKLFWDRLG